LNNKKKVQKKTAQNKKSDRLLVDKRKEKLEVIINMYELLVIAYA